MDLSIAAILAQDGITTGAIYALLALALVLVFSVTRAIFIPQGEFVSFGALTLAALQAQRVPATINLLLILGATCMLREIVLALWRRHWSWSAAAQSVLKFILLPLLLWFALQRLAPLGLPMAAQVALALAVVIPLGPFIYRLVYEPLTEASTLVLLIVSVAVHFVLVGAGLLMFGAEGSRTEPFTDATLTIGTLTVSGQSVCVLAVTVLLIGALYLYFGRTISGKALRATSINRLGARLVGIGTIQAGRLVFLLAAAMGALCGILIGPLTTIYYDSGFLIGFKGFVGAIIGGLASYPVAALGAVMVGLLESFASFWASEFKEVIVFTLIIPVLLWRSLAAPQVDEEQE
jgi:branched-chain amino acid transport system permease protein